MAAICNAQIMADTTLLDCGRDSGHTGLHLDHDAEIWWACRDNRDVTRDGHTRASAETSALGKLADVIQELSTDVGCSGTDLNERLSDLLEQLASRIRAAI